MFTLNEFEETANKVVQDLIEPHVVEYVAVCILMELPVSRSEWNDAVQFTMRYLRLYHPETIYSV